MHETAFHEPGPAAPFIVIKPAMANAEV